MANDIRFTFNRTSLELKLVNGAVIVARIQNF